MHKQSYSSLSIALAKQGDDAIDFHRVHVPSSDIHQYVILRLLCEGGQARVWIAVPRSQPDQCVVLKQYDLDVKRSDLPGASRQVEARLQRFKYELKILDNLKKAKAHHIVLPKSMSYNPVQQYGYLVLPYIDVPANMRDFIHSQLKQRPRQLLKGLRRIALALDTCHRLGIVHGDVKPRNILWNRLTKRPYLTDFGSSQFYLPDIEMDTQVGTLPYKAPELLLATCGKSLHRSVDMWALGCTLITYLCPDLKPPSQKNTSNPWAQSLVSSAYKGELTPTALKHKSWSEWCGSIDDTLFNKMLNGLLHLDPKARWSAKRLIDEITMLLLACKPRKA